MNILAEFKKLKDTVAGFMSDQSKATLASITEFSAKLTALETGALASLEAANTRIAGLEASKADAEGKVQDFTAKLSAANNFEVSVNDSIKTAFAALNLEYKAEGNPAEQIAALQTAVSGTLAKLSVPGSQIPAPAAKANLQADNKTKTQAEFDALNPRARMEFMRAGGRISG